MAIITKITPQKKKGRVNIFLDDEFYCGLDEYTLARFRLKEGVEISTQELDDIQLSSEGGIAFDKALKFISIRMRTKKEVKDYLYKKDYLPCTVNNTIDKLIEYKYINDAQFCNSYISFKKSTLGINRIKMDLIKYGVDKQIIDEALADLTQEDEAISIAKKYLRTHKPDKLKLKNFLYNKGFSYDDIKNAVYNAWEEIDDEEY